MVTTESPLPSHATLDAALDYVRKGWRVAPLFSPWLFSKTGITLYRDTTVSITGKVPRRLAHYLRPLKSEGEVRRWFGAFPVANIAVVTGLESGIVVLDVDHGPDTQAALAALNLPQTRRVATGRGEHWYFLHPGTAPIATIKGGLRGLTLMADHCSAVVAPPSRHANGATYRWINPEQPIALLPQACIDALAGKRDMGLLHRVYRFYLRPRYFKFPMYKAYYWLQDRWS